MRITPLQMTNLIEGYGDMRKLDAISSSIQDKITVRDPESSWATIRAALFTSGVLMAKEHGDFISASRYDSLSSLAISIYAINFFPKIFVSVASFND